MFESYATLAVRVLVVTVFAVSAAGKLRGRDRLHAFAASLAPLVRAAPRRLHVLAAAIAGAEVLVAVLTAVPPTAVAGLAGAAALLLAFCAGIVVAVRQRRGVRCRCFGSAGGELGPRHVVRNLLLVAVAVPAAVLSAVPVTGPALAPVGLVAAAVAGLAAAALFVHADALVTAVAPSA